MSEYEMVRELIEISGLRAADIVRVLSFLKKGEQLAADLETVCNRTVTKIYMITPNVEIYDEDGQTLASAPTLAGALRAAAGRRSAG